MEQSKLIAVEVAYATEKLQPILAVEVEEGATLQSAIEASGILSIFPEIDLMQQKVGIFSRKKALTDSVEAGDRIEIYRPLVMDPKEARRKRNKLQRLS